MSYIKLLTTTISEWQIRDQNKRTFVLPCGRTTSKGENLHVRQKLHQELGTVRVNHVGDLSALFLARGRWDALSAPVQVPRL